MPSLERIIDEYIWGGLAIDPLSQIGVGILWLCFCSLFIPHCELVANHERIRYHRRTPAKTP
jgi:hypothetical protein